MAGSPFDKKGGAAATAAPAKKAAPAAAAKAATKADPASLPDAAPMGSDTPIAKKGASPFDTPAAPAGITGYKPLHFLNQLVLIHTTEHGAMKTAYSTVEKPLQEFVKVDLIPLTLPEEFGFTNKFGEYEACEPFEVGDRLDDLMFFNGPLVREGKRMLDRNISWVLGRIAKGERKPNQDAPVIIVPATEEDQAIYNEWRAAAQAG
ncbi:hypothetical protein PHELEMICH_48 [Mycobacterium phage Phelemich]|uniref:Uncharacterized protein n=2 Tax=Acadianvirus reprobate TaxID=1982903 RepID=S5Y7R0_9CAUD|nr:hypothetical protein N847_gp48 [Mycobacterium phage Phelemich]YP_008409970.1 hypothetical protein REPROBATE_49 [Mycobacterium phage Reprobate]AGT12785.1 hypothetical protein REPROBATE_49 [Mycobacterium phage Reprobate]AGT13962.1 hypothetical protein PHELEMICH_48 [Mycobacterium phage Phelemich]